MNSRLFYQFAGSLSCCLAAALSGCALPGMYMGKTADDARTQSADSANASAVALPDGTVVNFIALDPSVLATLPRYAPPVGHANLVDNGLYIYRIGHGDILRVTVWDHPELNNPGLGTTPSSSSATAADIAVATGSNDPLGRVVAADGTIYFPYIGRIKVSGLSVPEARSLLARRLATYIRDPQLDVSVASFRSERAYVSGEVQKPGIASLGEVPTTVADLINSVGGVTVDADLYHATLTRNGTQIPVDLYALLNEGDMSLNYRIRANDMLNIPSNRYNKVFVLGEVIKPASLVIPKGNYTLAEAISDSGGLSQLAANAAQVYVIRRMQGGLANAYILDSRSPAAMVLADDFNLRPRDIIFVDPTGITRFSRVITQIAPFLSGSNNAVNAANNVR